MADDLHAVHVGDLAGLRTFDIAAALDREIDDHRARLHRRDHFLADQLRRRRPGISAVVMTMSCFLMCSAVSAACFA
jgi:hypothetical protein